MNGSNPWLSSGLRNVSPAPEFVLLICCLKARLADCTSTSLETIASGIDWKVFMQLAAKHRTLAFAAPLLRSHDEVPINIRESLRESVATGQRRALSQLAELGRIIDQFERCDIQVLTLKGPVLSLQIHGDIAWRRSGDLDILVTPKNVESADRALRELGYELSDPNITLTTAQTRRYLRRRHHYHYVHAESKNIVELHWRLTSNSELLPLNFDTLYAARELVQIGKHAFPALSALHLRLFLYCHGALHGWECLGWIYDIAVLQTDGKFDWPELLAAARDLGLERLPAQAALLSMHFFGAEIPTVVRSVCDRDQSVARLVQSALMYAAIFAAPKRQFRSEHLFYRLLLSPRMAYKRGVLIEEICSTGILPFAAAPGYLLPFYALLRPLFWVRRKFASENTL